LPLFAKEGNSTSLWKREVRKDLKINVFILMTLLVALVCGKIDYTKKKVDVK
jgi:hypothetical protein